MAQRSRSVSALALALALLLLPPTTFGEEHLVTSAAVQARFAAARAERDDHRRILEAALASPAVREAAEVARVDLDRLRSRVAYLTDGDLQELAARSQVLERDVTAGAHPVVIVLAVIGGLMILALILVAVSCGTGASCD